MNFLDDIKNKLEKNEVVDIVYYGSSTTSVEYIFPNWAEIIRYVLKFELDSDYRQVWWNLFTHNMGLDGAKSSDLLKNLQKLVLDRNSYLMFLDAGINDYYFEVDLNETKKNISEIIKRALDSGVKVVYWTSAPSAREDKNKAYDVYHKAEQEIAQNFSQNKNFLFIDLFLLFSKEDIAKSYTLIEPDGNKVLGLKPGDLDYVHFNRYGNAVIAKILLKEAFNVNFDENKFLKSLSDNTKKYPDY